MALLSLILVSAAAPAATSDLDARGIRTVNEGLAALHQLRTGRTPDGGTPPVPRGNPGDWIRWEDYPATALADDAEGKVSFEAKVDPQGRVSLCTVTVSSGTASLDDATCNLVTQRALFVPARDKRGKPTWGIYRSRVVWTMKSRAMPHPNSESYSTTFIVEADGTVTDCRIDNPALDAPTLARALAGCGKAQYEPYTDNAGDPVRRRVRWTVKAEVVPVEP